MNVSFAGMQIRYGHFRSKGFVLDVVYHGRSVFKSGSFLGLPAPIDTCIAKMAGYNAPVALVYSITGVCCASFLQVVYPTSGERYVTTVFDVASEFDIRVLGGSLALIVGDPRFDFLFTDGAGSITPVRAGSSSRLGPGTHVLWWGGQPVQRAVGFRLGLVTVQRPSLAGPDGPELVHALGPYAGYGTLHLGTDLL
jgi:hypothetical protein